jgi:hypothetical protein
MSIYKQTDYLILNPLFNAADLDRPKVLGPRFPETSSVPSALPYPWGRVLGAGSRESSMLGAAVPDRAGVCVGSRAELPGCES